MDYSTIEENSTLNPRYVKSYRRDISKFQKLLDIDTSTFNFNVFEIIKTPIEKIDSILIASLPVSSCQNILSSLVKYLKLANQIDPDKFHISVTDLNKLMRTYDTKYKQSKSNSKSNSKSKSNSQPSCKAEDITEGLSDESLIFKIQSCSLNKKISPAVRAMCAILISRETVMKKLKVTVLSTIVNYSLEAHQAGENYISIEKGILFIKNREEPLSKTFIDLISDILIGHNCLLPDLKGLKYENVDNASKQAGKSFKDIIGESYSKLCSMDFKYYKQETLESEEKSQSGSLLKVSECESTSKSEVESDSKSKSDSDSQSGKSETEKPQKSETPETPPAAVIKIKIKPKIKAIIKPVQELKDNVRLDVYEWDYFIKESADHIHISRVKTILTGMDLSVDKFYHCKLDSPEGLSNFNIYLKTVENANTKVNLLNSLCKFLERTMARHYTDYTLLKNKFKLELSQKNSERSVVNYLELVKKFQVTINNPTISNDLKLVCLLLSEIINVQDMTTGALRFSDMSKTLLFDDGKHNYLDLNTKLWYLRAGCTKNKTDRVAKVSDSFIKGVQSLVDLKQPLICQNGKTDQISRLFKKYIGVNFSDARASYVTYLDTTCKDSDTIRQICENHGHKLSTALEDYRRTTDTK